MKNNNTLSGERLSFYKLFSEKRYRIAIPIIQRDYAQGRKTRKEVRNNFLDALFEYLDENIPNRDLDFVYGSLNETASLTDFIPLDGQQRLTTLFLLHWYLCQISENNTLKAQFKSTLSTEGKSMFTYETRISSSDFCDALMTHNIDFGNLINNSLRKTIKNESWFFLSWKYDPTIQSMLTMLDAIHDKFADKAAYLERLLDIENPIITFLFLNLKDFKLTDDLYIKMNARGKPLTPFENFKAKFEQHLESTETERKFEPPFKTLKSYFAHNIDTKWADLFWNYRHLAGDKNTYDEEMKNFVRIIFTNQYAISKQDDDNFKSLLNNSDDISYYKYKELNAITEQGILYLIDAFDTLCNKTNKIKTHLSDNYTYYFDENAVFENALKNDFNKIQERISFHAYIRFLIENKNDRTGIEQWMRVIHNLANNSIIDGNIETIRAISSIEKMLPKSNTIIQYLSENPKIESFANWQVTEEVIKAHLIIKSDNWRKSIEDLEKHDCFRGQIGFALEFAGIISYYNNNKNCEWTEQEDKKYLKSFKNYADKATAVFNNKKRYNGDFIWERAVLTKGNYAISSKQDNPTKKNCLNLLHTDTVANNIYRDYSWNRLLRIDDNNENMEKRQYVKQVFDDKNFDKNNLVSSLENICNNSDVQDWRAYFIANPELMHYCKKGFIKKDSDSKIYLLASIACGANQYFVEMHTYHLWKTKIEPNLESYSNFELIYDGVKSIEDIPWITFRHDICRIQIYYSLNSYQIWFQHNNNDGNITKIMNGLGFEWYDQNKWYFSNCENSDDLMNKLNALNEKLKELAHI